MSSGHDGAIYVQYGCGLSAPEGWLNFDSSPRLRLERMPLVMQLIDASVGKLFPKNVRFGDIIRGLPVAENSVQAVYCSHVLEHLPRDDVPKALANTWRILVPGGVFRLVVPDLLWRAVRYVEAAARDDDNAADMLLDDSMLGRRTRPKTLIGLGRELLGHSAHLWMYDFAALKRLLEHAGFEKIRRCEIGDRTDRMFAAIEDHSRYFEGGERELAIEALRPIPA